MKILTLIPLKKVSKPSKKSKVDHQQNNQYLVYIPSVKDKILTPNGQKPF
jgi:hypothetical protein